MLMYLIIYSSFSSYNFYKLSMFIYFLLIFCSNIAKKFLKSLFHHNKAQMATCLTIFTVGKMVFTKKSTCLIRGNLGGWNTSHLTLFLNYFLIVDMIFSGSFMIINERICIAELKIFFVYIIVYFKLLLA